MLPFPRLRRSLATCSLPALALFLMGGAARAQVTSPAMPAPTQQPANSIPSVPPATPQQTQIPAAQVPTPSPAPYQDPLEQPITVKGGTPAPVPTAEPSTASSMPFLPPYEPDVRDAGNDPLGSTYIPVDSPVYAMALRLYSLGYLDTAFLNMRPWTRRSLLHALDETSADVVSDSNPQAMSILSKLNDLLEAETPGRGIARGKVYGVETVYSRFMGIGGQTLRDSYHLGQSVVNDYGRPYQPGFNNITGFSSVNEWGRFSLYVRGEYQHSPSAAGYSTAMRGYLSDVDQIPFNGFNLHQSTIPETSIAAVNPFRLQEASLSFHVLGHEISGGKSDAWLGPGYGGAMAWSNNAEDIYSFRINRVEPMHIPYVSRVLGPLRYDFFVGSLKGHTFPNSPWTHSAMFAFAPTPNFQFGFQRTVIWGGEGHTPITLHTFLKSFFDINDTTAAEKYSRSDPGARFSSFNFSYRLPFMRKYVTLYTDSTTHDDVTPISAPRRAGWRPGIVLSQIPGLPQMELRAEGTYTDYVTLRSTNGVGNYFETVQRQGYTNKGFIFGDWIGREAKGGQAWLTYHLSGNEYLQLSYLHKKTAKDFIVYGVTQNDVKLEIDKRFTEHLDFNAWLQYETFTAPIYKQGLNSNTTVAFQFTYYPGLHTANSSMMGR